MKPELSKLIPLMVIGLTLSATPSMAQTAGSDGTGTASTTPAAGADTNTPTANNEGAFTALSPGGQKITRALYDAQKTPSTGTTGESGTSGTSIRSLDDIAAAKASGQGWGQVFKEMKADGLIEEKNLGQVISGANHRNRVPQEGTTTDATAAGAAATANSVSAASAHQRKPVTVTLANGESVTVGGHRNRGAGAAVNKTRRNDKIGHERREGQGAPTGQKHDYQQGIVSGTGGKFASGNGSYRGNHKSDGIDGGHGRHSSGAGVAYGSGTTYGEYSGGVTRAHGNNGVGSNGNGASGKGRH